MMMILMILIMKSCLAEKNYILFHMLCECLCVGYRTSCVLMISTSSKVRDREKSTALNLKSFTFYSDAVLRSSEVLSENNTRMNAKGYWNYTISLYTSFMEEIS